jgi:hypothetical protein
MKHLATAATLLLLTLHSAPAAAQQSTTFEGLTLRDTFAVLTGPLGTGPVGEAISFATAIDVATAPFGTSSGGFVFKLDPATGLRVRTATTFGPAFAERALTSGEGKVSVAASFINATYDKLGDLSLEQMELSRIPSSIPEFSRRGFASLVMSSETLVLAGAVGATDDFDVGVAVPMVKIKLDGISWVTNGNGEVILHSRGAAISSGLGDMAVWAKYRLLKFGDGQPDPGGVTGLVTVRLPTGSRPNLRGLGLTRTMASLLISSGRGKFRPHANVGYEFWEKGFDVAGDPLGRTIVTARNRLQYAAGIELEAAPKLTLVVDFLGRHIHGGGRVLFQTFEADPDNPFGVERLDFAVATGKGIRKLSLVPGIKWNLKGAFLLSLNALVALDDNSLHDKFTPVVGLDWTF